MRKQTLGVFIVISVLVSGTVNAGGDWEDIGRGIIFGGITLGLLNNAFGGSNYYYQPPRNRVYIYEENTYYDDYDYRPRRDHHRRNYRGRGHHHRSHHRHYNDW